jgi:hypothetical protein
MNILKNIRATAMHNSVVNINGGINSNKKNIIFEYRKGSCRTRLVFPQETSGGSY